MADPIATSTPEVVTLSDLAAKPVLLLGPVGVPGKPDASWAELLRCIADALEAETPQTPVGVVAPVATPAGQHPAPDSTVPA